MMLAKIAIFGKTYKSFIFSGGLFFFLGCKFPCCFFIDNAGLANNIEKGGLNEFDPNELDEVQYAVVILTGPNNIVRRDTIRNTWMKLCSNLLVKDGEIIYKWNHTLTPVILPNYIKFFFVIGTKILNKKQIVNLRTENKRTKDLLLLEDVEEHYELLSEKVARTMEWFGKNMKNMNYLIKCDDDSFVRVDLLIQNLGAFAPEMSDPKLRGFVTYKKTALAPKELYWGLFYGRGRVQLNGKWRENDWFLCDKYLPYAIGGVYVLSKGIVEYVGQNHQIFNSYISEDVSMGVWTAALRWVNRVHDRRFDSEWTSRGCKDHMLIRHKQSIADMWAMYEYLVWTKGEKLCILEFVRRHSYRYIWEGLPSLSRQYVYNNDVFLLPLITTNTNKIRPKNITLRQSGKNRKKKYLRGLLYYKRDFYAVFIDNGTELFMRESNSHLADFILRQQFIGTLENKVGFVR